MEKGIKLKDIINQLPTDINIKISDKKGKTICYFESVCELYRELKLLDRFIITYQYQQEILQGDWTKENPYILRYINIILK